MGYFVGFDMGFHSGIPSECQTVWTQIRTDDFVCPDLGQNCWQSKEVHTSGERVIARVIFYYTFPSLLELLSIESPEEGVLAIITSSDFCLFMISLASVKDVCREHASSSS